MFDTNKNIDGTSQYSYGIDTKGKMYVYNKSTGKMAYYGDLDGGAKFVYTKQGQGGKFTSEGDQRKTAQPAAASAPLSNSTGGAALGGGTAKAAKTLDVAQLQSLDSLLGSFDTVRNDAKTKATLKRDAAKREKAEEKKREESKYNGKKISTLQEFASAKGDTDISTRDTIENLVSSLSTLGLGGGRALQRQILDAANRSNRKANATQATNNQALDSAFNEYTAGNENDLKKIDDQFGFDAGEADRKYYQDRQNTLFKKADVYNAADKTAEREAIMREGNGINSLIAGSTFLNPSYTGESRAMATPELSTYTQDIAKYDTSGIGGAGLTPADAGAPAGNLAVKAVAINDKDFGIKKKVEGDIAYGV